MTIRLSIRYKILAVLGVLLAVAVSFYTLLASSIFRHEKTALLYDINHSIAVNIAAQIRAAIVQTGQQMKMHLFSEVFSSRTGRISQKALTDSNVLGIEILRRNSDKYVSVPTSRSFPIKDFDIQRIELQLADARTDGYSLWSEPESRRFFMAADIDVQEGDSDSHYTVVTELDGSVFFAPFKSANLFQSFLSKSKGDVVLSFDKSEWVQTTSIADHPLLRAAVGGQGGHSGVLAFQYGDDEWYGAYAPVGIGNLYFVSQASAKEVTTATHVLIKRSLLFALIVITVTFMASILFSKTLTKNLQLLTDRARVIEKGELSSNIKIRSGDEIEELAVTFNSMVNALRASRDAIEKYNRELEEKVAMRTQQLHETNAAIKEVQEQLLKSTQLAAVGEVAGRTAHEVLNPLTSLVSRIERTRTEVQTHRRGLPEQFSEILTAWEKEFSQGGVQKLFDSLKVASTVDPKQTLIEEDLKNLRALCDHWLEEQNQVGRDLQFVHKEAERIRRIVDQMRQLVRSSEVKEDVHCHELLHHAISTMADFTEKHGVILQEVFKAESDSAHLNRDEFVQIVTNLIRNAYQAISMHHDDKKLHGVVQISTYNAEDRLRIEISDTGVGIPEDKQALIFDQGFTTKAPTEGTGLGLAICRRYARAFGGDVELVASTPGAGTTFAITVPLQRSADLKIAV